MISVAPEHADRVEQHLDGLSCRRVGRTTEAPHLTVRSSGQTWLDVAADELRVAFKETLADE
jgi:hypothetical protein